MVYKIRNKGFNIFTPQLNHRVHIPKKTKLNADLKTTVTIQVQITRYTGLRIQHNYRNISRAMKQFLLGDKIFEQLMILRLKEFFYAPMYYKAPIEQTFYMVSFFHQDLLVKGKGTCRFDWQALRFVCQ